MRTREHSGALKCAARRRFLVAARRGDSTVFVANPFQLLQQITPEPRPLIIRLCFNNGRAARVDERTKQQQRHTARRGTNEEFLHDIPSFRGHSANRSVADDLAVPLKEI